MAVEISVIVPIFMVEKYLVRCIESVLIQTFRDFELILVNDGSTDGCGRICAEYEKKDQRVKVINKPNGGVSTARNMGLDNASGRFIAFIDPDDVIHPDYFKLLLESMQRFPNTEISICDYMRISEKESNSIQWNDIRTPSCSLFSFEDYDYGNDYSLRHVWGAIISRELIGSIRFREDIFIGEDSLFMAQVCAKAHYYVRTQQQLYCYVEYKQNATKKIEDSKLITELVAWDEILQLVSKNDHLRQGCSIALMNVCKEKVLSVYQNETRNSRILIKAYHKKVRETLFPMLCSRISWKVKVLNCVFCIHPVAFIAMSRFLDWKADVSLQKSRRHDR